MNTMKIDRGQTKLIAHRGLSGIEQENTCAAFVAAGNRSYFGIETDVYVTAAIFYIIFYNTAKNRCHNIRSLPKKKGAAAGSADRKTENKKTRAITQEAKAKSFYVRQSLAFMPNISPALP